MRLVLSLIGAQAKRGLLFPSLSTADVAAARSALASAGAIASESDWLAPGEACDLVFESPEPGAALEAVRGALRDRPIDVNAVSPDFRRKRLLIADMDSTLIEQECIDELAAEMGVGPLVAAITERAMRGEIAFEPALRERVRLLEGLAVAVAESVLTERITLMPGAATLVATMRSAGAHTALVSGGFTAFAGPIAERLGFHEHRANLLLEAGGVFTGFVEDPILGRDAKQAALLELTKKLRLDPAESLAVGDGANDLGMIRQAGLGVAYRAKPAVRAAAGAAIDHADLTGLLFLQGYRREEFVDA